MALNEYAGVWLGYANIFIAVFITIYAHLFLKQTKRHRDRRPWDFLFMASFLYLVFQVFNVLVLSGVTLVVETVNLLIVGNIMSFFYSSLVLLAFVSQHDLILKSQLILISKKDNGEQKKRKKTTS